MLATFFSFVGMRRMALGSQRRVVTTPAPEGDIPESESPFPHPMEEIGETTAAPL